MLETGLYICVQSYLAQRPLSVEPLYEEGLNEKKNVVFSLVEKYFLLQSSQRQESKFSTNKSKYFFCYNNEEI
jgi:hypothetical protein